MNHQKLSLWTASSVLIGTVIGSGVFVKPGKVLLATQSSNLSLLAWILGGLITLAAGLTVAEVAARFPNAGGIYGYIEKIYGRAWAFVAGWTQVSLYGPGIMSALSLYFASLTCHELGWASNSIRPVALSVLAFLSSILVIGSQYSGWISKITTILKLIPIFLIGFFGLFMGTVPILSQSIAVGDQTQLLGRLAGFGSAVLSTLWAYDGWAMVTNLAPLMDKPQKDLPKAIVWGLLTVMCVYLMVNMSLFHVISVEQINKLGENAVSLVAQIIFGDFGGKLISIGVIISIFGSLNGNILTLGRVPYLMASEGNFPYATFFSKTILKTKSPLASIILMVGIAVVMIVFLNPDRITDIAMFSIYLFFGFLIFGFLKLRRNLGPNTEKGIYQVPLYPYVPLFSLIGIAFICGSQIVNNPIDAFSSLALSACGFPIYLLIREAK